MKVKATIMGCGSSLGVPAAGNFWGKCDPDNPKNHRTRSSLLLQSETTTVLVDATPDIRQHLNTHNINRLDGIVLSHFHSDHINGLDDLRVISYAMEQRIELHTNKETAENIKQRCGYAFHGDDGIYRPFLHANIVDYADLRIGDIHMQLFKQDHGTCDTIGVRVGDFAYSVDMVDLEESALEEMKGVKTWVVDGGGYHRPDIATHATIERVRHFADKLEIEQVYLIVLTGMMDYDTLCAELPAHIRPAYDGLVLEI